MYRVHYDDMNIVFVSNYYDTPLQGLCIQDGRLCSFEIDWVEEDDPVYYNVTPLSFLGRIKARFRQKMFEICVGRHWTYVNGKRNSHYYIRSPRWLHDFLFKAYYYITMDRRS